MNRNGLIRHHQPLIGPKTTSKVGTKYEQQTKSLTTWNKWAFVLHGVSFVAALIMVIIFASGSLQTELTTDFRVYDSMSTNPSQAGPFSVKQKSLGFYQLAWVELPFPLITSIFHGIIAFVPYVNQHYTRDAIIDGTNWIRWLEYAITASFMTWVIMQASGVTNVLILIVVGIIGNIVLQYQGYLMEKLNVGKSKRDVVWGPTVVGWLVFVGQWIIIMTYFFSAVASRTDGVPLFVYFIVIGLFFQFSLFGVVQLLHYWERPRFLAKYLDTGYKTERAYIILSFVSKFFLDWTLIFGIVTNQMN